MKRQLHNRRRTAAPGPVPHFRAASKENILQHQMLLAGMKHLQECVCLTDLNENIRYVNSSFLRTYGYETEEVLNKKLTALLMPANQPARPGESRPQSYAQSWRGEMLHSRKDGTVFPALVLSSLVRDERGVPHARIFISLDVTQSKQAEYAVRESEQRYRVILQSISDEVMIVTDQGLIETVNDMAASRRYVPSQRVMVGAHLRDVFPPLAALQRLEALERVMAGKQPIQIEEVIDMPEESIWLSTKVNPLFAFDGSCTKVVMVSRDITMQKEREEFLRSFSRSILSAQEAERKRVARELHDGLAQSLTALRLNLRRAESAAPPDAAPLHAQLAEAIDFVSALMEETRRIARNLTPAILEDIGLMAAIKKMAHTLDGTLDVTIREEVPALDGMFRRGEEIHIYRVLQEIFANIDHHAAAAHVELTVRRSDGNIEFIVSDDGVGFDAEQAVTESISTGDHRGLRGLQERARLLDGMLEIRSAPLRGTTITFRLPVRMPVREEES